MIHKHFRSSIPALLACLIAATTAMGADRTAQEIVKDIDAIQTPAFDPSRRSDSAYMQKLQRDFAAAAAKRDTLTLELFKVDPDNDRLVKLMPQHWMRQNPYGPGAAKLNAEIADVLEKSHNEKLKLEALFTRAQLSLIKGQQSGKLDMAEVEGFIKKAGKKDDRGALVLQMAMQVTQDDKLKQTLEDRIIADYPDSNSASSIQGVRRQREAVGKPFELEFADAVSGSTISMKALKGKVVVIDFWATWCGPCVAEMPNMKKLYAEYHDKGVEFIGISLDQPKEQGGLDSLKKYVKENAIGWPQYYQGKGWASEFSRSWGINAIPCMFVVDARGNLYSIEARGKLEQMLPKLLKDKDGKSPAAGGE